VNRVRIRYKNSEFAALHSRCKDFIVVHQALITRSQMMGLVPLILIGVLITEMVFDEKIT
jgi:hypothetical protein